MKVVLFGKENCNPCRQVKKALERKRIEYTYMDTTPEVANENRISSVPTLKIYGPDLMCTDIAVGAGAVMELIGELS